jgi:hypothetical protein
MKLLKFFVKLFRFIVKLSGQNHFKKVYQSKYNKIFNTFEKSFESGKIINNLTYSYEPGKHYIKNHFYFYFGTCILILTLGL